MPRRRLELLIAVHRRERHIGVRRHKTAGVIRLQFERRFAQPPVAALVGTVHPVFFARRAQTGRAIGSFSAEPWCTPEEEKYFQ